MKKTTRFTGYYGYENVLGYASEEKDIALDYKLVPKRASRFRGLGPHRGELRLWGRWKVTVEFEPMEEFEEYDVEEWNSMKRREAEVAKRPPPPPFGTNVIRATESDG